MMIRKPTLALLVTVGGLILAGAAAPACGQCEEQKLHAGDAAADDHFGFSLGISGNSLVVGALNHDHAGPNAGAAYVSQLDDNGTPDDRCDDTWIELCELIADDTAAHDYFGMKVAICGDYIVVGTDRNDHGGLTDAGAAYIFYRHAGGPNQWGQVAKLTASDAATNDNFGEGLAINGDYVVVGASHDDHAGGSNAGSAYVYWRDDNGTPEDRSDDHWIELDKLTASDAASNDFFGSVSISGDYIAVGAHRHDHGGHDAGAAYIFHRQDNGTPEDPSDDTWIEEAEFIAGNAGGGDLFGYAICIDGDYVIAGSMQNDTAGPSNAGSAYVFAKPPDGWASVSSPIAETHPLTAYDAGQDDYFGGTVAICGDYVLVGAGRDSHAGGSEAGSAYLFLLDDNGTPEDHSDDHWIMLDKLTACDAGPGDWFGGHSISLSGDYALVSSDQDGDHGADSGSAYVFRLPFDPDCNGNCMPDDQDIAAGTSADCNANGIPDECDIAEGTSPDNNGNGIPDECEPLPLDIKPGSCPNPLNPSSHGVLPVAVVGTGDFDVTLIDVSSVVLVRADGVGGQVTPNEGPPGPHSTFEDVATPLMGEPCECGDLSGDGIVDLSMKFRTDDVVELLELDDLNPGDEVELVVTGLLLDGSEFATAGDCILIVPQGSSSTGVRSNVPGTFIEIDPPDLNVDAGGFANFGRTYHPGTVATLTAPDQAGGFAFQGWLVDGVFQNVGQTTLQVTVIEDATVQAVYRLWGTRPSIGLRRSPTAR